MNQEQLRSLRERILNDITPLVIDSAATSADRFALLIRVIQAGNASSELYSKAYESAKSIEDKGEQLNALMALLDEVDFDANQGTKPENVPQEAAAPQSSNDVQAPPMEQPTEQREEQPQG